MCIPNPQLLFMLLNTYSLLSFCFRGDVVLMVSFASRYIVFLTSLSLKSWFNKSNEWVSSSIIGMTIDLLHPSVLVLFLPLHMICHLLIGKKGERVITLQSWYQNVFSPSGLFWYGSWLFSSLVLFPNNL